LTFTALPGATGQTYTPTFDDIGRQLQVRVTGTNNNGSGVAYSALTAPVTAALGGGLLMDGLSVIPLAAVSFRKLSVNYTGACIKGTTTAANGSGSGTDVGFSGTDLDTSALAAIGTDVYLHSWLDQSGNGRDFVDNLIFGNTLTRPKVRVGSANVVLNSHVCMQCTNNEGNKAGPAYGVTRAHPVTYYLVAKWDTKVSHFLDCTGGVRNTLGQGGSQMFVYDGTTAINTQTSDTNLHCFIMELNNTAWSLSIDGVQTSGVFPVAGSPLSSDTVPMLGGNANNTPTARYCEYMMFTGTSLTANDKAALVASARAYWGTP
jgi:hypothetical protein